MKRVYGIILLVLTAAISFGQISFKAETRNPVREGERFRLKFSVNASGENFAPPAIQDFRVLSGPNKSTNSSIQIINGSMTRTVNHDYYYTLQALKEGVYEIGSATIEVDGETYKSDPISIRVMKGNPPASSSNTGSTSTETIEGVDEDYAFLKAEVSNTSPMLGEQVMITYKLYYRVAISDYGISQSPSYPGCWSQDISDKNAPEQQVATVNGKQYNVAEIYKEAIFPQKSGKIVTKPMKFEIVARVKDKRSKSNDPFDSFFNDPFFGGRSVRKELSSTPITFNVKNLPLEGQPAAFNSAVGQFTVSSKLDNNEVVVNDAINLTYTISGKGNLKLIDPPTINFPPDFEVYDPEVSDNIKTSSYSGVSGSKTFKYLVIPRVSGTFTIDPITFSYYDLKTKSYKTTTTQPYTITVEKGNAQTNQGITVRSGGQQDITYLGNDIRFIMTGDLKLQPIGVYFFGSGAFYLALLLPVLLFIAILVWMRISKSRKSNVALQNEKQATRIAKKRLKKSKECIKKQQHEAFYEELSQAIWGYLSFKFNIALADLSVDTVKSHLQEKSVQDELIDDFADTLEACEFARFAPGNKEKKIEELYAKAQQVIIKTEKQLK